ncbi:unnamed protein product [Cylicocyclus nassatus]|uniref:Uncharacterized protein n=1 Tax=Cylicocyclus nassatus TaxID=53992 RepID=A0AA36MB33_CYLNA|nr:unnamed protein product [Cylicocyclus nassatus]
MLADADDFSDNLDSSYGYAPIVKRKVEIEEYVQDVASGDASVSDHPLPPTFLRADLNPEPPGNFASETAIRAGCSEDCINAARSQVDGPVGLDDLMSKVSDSDASRLSTQLRRELECEWKSTSLSTSAFTEDAHLDLLHMYDLLCNINLQLLVMQREMLKHETAAHKFRESGQLKAFGYEDGSNKEQLCRLMCSLSISSSKLCERIDSLNRALLGSSISGSKNDESSLLSRFMLPASITVCVLGFLFIHMRNGTS